MVSGGMRLTPAPYRMAQAGEADCSAASRGGMPDLQSMIRYKEIGFVAYPVTDIPRARKFYEGTLGLKPNAPLKSETQQWIEYDIGPNTLGIGCSDQWKPSKDGPSVALEVEDFGAAVEALKKHHIEFIIGPMETPVCHMATFRDPDGNKLTIHRRKTA